MTFGILFGLIVTPSTTVPWEECKTSGTTVECATGSASITESSTTSQTWVESRPVDDE